MAKRALKSTSKSSRSDRAAARGEPLRPRGQWSVSATHAKNRFGEILQAARDVGPVFIERHGQPQAVVLGIEAYKKLAATERTPQEQLACWTREFDALCARMQTRKTRQAVDALFCATDTKLNRRDA